jgi:hypothetical protein
MTPKLALSYASTGGRSPYGYGWTLPVGRISRSTKYGVPKYDNDLDTFVLELPSATLELVRGVDSRFHAKFEGSFFQITFDENLGQWLVFDKDGTAFVFGYDPANRHSRIDRVAASGETTFAWLLSQVIDPWGNSIDYWYEAPLADAQSGRLGLVCYGGIGEMAEDSMDLDHTFCVTLGWSAAGAPAAPQLSYAGGYREVVDDRRVLETIETHYPDGSGGSAIARRYSFTYDTDEQAYHRTLTQVAVTGYDADQTPIAIPPARFEYAPAVQVDWPGPDESNRVDNYAWAFDFDAPMHSRGDPVRYDTFDINGDGLVDFVNPLHGPNPSTASVRLGNGRVSGSIAPFGPWQNWSWPSDREHIRQISNDSGNILTNIFDVTGDGLPDFVDTIGNRCVGECQYCDRTAGMSIETRAADSPLLLSHGLHHDRRYVLTRALPRGRPSLAIPSI